jgi:acyl-CoA reductase-like NAD-dependent aldehyde dehydrogenase
MAAGCCSVIKLPEATPHFSTLFEKLITQCVDTDFVRVIQGAVPETSKASVRNSLL